MVFIPALRTQPSLEQQATPRTRKKESETDVKEEVDVPVIAL